MNNNQKVQLSIVGNVYIGKTSLIYRIKEDKFYPTLPVGVAPDFISAKYGKTYLQIIDMHGSCLQDQNSLSISFIKHSQSVVVGFALDDKGSCDSINHWVEKCVENVKESTPILIVGTKLDLIPENQFEEKKQKINTHIQAILNEFAKKDHKIEINIIKNKDNDYFFPVSAKNKIGIDDLLQAWVKEAQKISRDPGSVMLTKGRKKNRKCC